MAQPTQNRANAQGPQTEAKLPTTGEPASTPEEQRTRAERIISFAMRGFDYHVASQGHDKKAMSLMQQTLKDLQARIRECDSDKARIDTLTALQQSEVQLAHRSTDAFGKVTPNTARWNFHETLATAERGWHERHVTQDGIELILVGGPKNAHNAIAALADDLRDAMRYDRGTAERGLNRAIEELDKINPPSVKLPPLEK